MAISSAVSRLQEACSKDWQHINSLRESSRETIEAIAGILASADQRLVPADTCFVTYGSLARGEWTTGSDIDWTLLLDGQVDEAHLTAAQSIGQALAGAGFAPPGRTAAFGSIVFSHQLVHRIGGDDDSNQNTTRRILLLMESKTVGDNGEVRARVMRQLFKRYIEDDHGYRIGRERVTSIPRFLLNDVVRYWRIMAVDFAAKRRVRAGEGWAIRSFKLRMSRKLLFSNGLVMCLRCLVRPAEPLIRQFQSDDEYCAAIADHLFNCSERSPLDNLAQTLLDFGAIDAASMIFEAYDDFLSILNDGDSRRELESLTVEQAEDNDLFLRAREIGHRFQDGLSELFFRTDEELTKASQRYGVF